MTKRIGRYTLQMENRPTVEGFASVVGKKEMEGPLSEYFDLSFEDTTLGESSWEKAESRLQKEAVTLALKKAGVTSQDIDYIFAGDLLNQCISSTFGLRSLDIPMLGQFGACSTMAQTMALASIFVETGAARLAAAVTSSHFCSAERQFRLPLEYGGQRTPTAQWTATASGSVILGTSGKGPFVSAVTVGRISDLGIKDAANMGAAMAPAAAQTIHDFLHDTGTVPNDYDLILTGDLGLIGTELVREILIQNNLDITDVHNDCGMMLFHREKQDVHAGGSGCGCSASVLCSVILQRLQSRELNNVLFVATGALMSPTSQQQGESVPGIAHLLHLTST
ncbi:stage V sporulation protein AD [Clostridium minihomine]|uniref:stage V sporulation protein AD n=1 Tax=Clostridium minihomine TaxID=2045012 RepID=UPI000C765812|nr:stage V sporulation protein AD [Clostridium minihomine]